MTIMRMTTWVQGAAILLPKTGAAILLEVLDAQEEAVNQTTDAAATAHLAVETQVVLLVAEEAQMVLPAVEEVQVVQLAAREAQVIHQAVVEVPAGQVAVQALPVLRRIPVLKVLDQEAVHNLKPLQARKKVPGK